MYVFLPISSIYRCTGFLYADSEALINSARKAKLPIPPHSNLKSIYKAPVSGAESEALGTITERDRETEKTAKIFFLNSPVLLSQPKKLCIHRRQIVTDIFNYLVC